MATLSFKFILENSHTFIRLTEDGPKVKVVTGEIIEIDEKIVNKGRMYLAGFRQIGEDGEAQKEGNDVAVEEAEAKRIEEEKLAKAEAKKAEKAAKEVEGGNKVPEIVVPGNDVAVKVETKDDGEDAIIVKVTK